MIIPAQIDESTIGDINKYVEDSYNALKESKPVLVALGCSFKGRIIIALICDICNMVRL